MGNLDEAKGRVKQAVGDLAEDDDLRREGRGDEHAAMLKDKVGELEDKAEDAIDGTIDKVKDTITDRD